MTRSRVLIISILASVALTAVACRGDENVVMRVAMAGASMEPMISDGDVVDVIDYLDASPQRSDIIVFMSPTNPNRTFLKRIIGVPGDTVEIDRETGTVAVNGQVIDEPYVRGSTTCALSCGPWVVPERSYFVMGDNRNNSSDSRQGWFVPEENIIGWVEQ